MHRTMFGLFGIALSERKKRKKCSRRMYFICLALRNWSFAKFSKVPARHEGISRSQITMVAPPIVLQRRGPSESCESALSVPIAEMLNEQLKRKCGQSYSSSAFFLRFLPESVLRSQIKEWCISMFGLVLFRTASSAIDYNFHFSLNFRC